MTLYDFVGDYLGQNAKVIRQYNMGNEILQATKESGKYFAEHYVELEKYFLTTFVTEKMQNDFPIIAKDFLKNNFKRVEDPSKCSRYVEDHPKGFEMGLNSGTRFLEVKFMNILYYQAKNEDAFSKAQLMKIYQTYYRKEYNQLKRFSMLRPDDIVVLSHSKDYIDLEAIVRIIIMSHFYDIKINVDYGLGPIVAFAKLSNLELENKMQSCFESKKKGKNNF